MNDIRKERLVLVIVTIAAVACTMQIFFGHWDFWVPPVLGAGLIVLWGLHITEKTDMKTRGAICFAFSAFLVFYNGIHKTSLFDISAMVALFMAVFTVYERVFFLNLVMIEYLLIQIIQFCLLYRAGELSMSAFQAMRVSFHIGVVVLMYLFCRSTVRKRIAEREAIEEWHRAVTENDHDMEDFLSNISHELRTPVNVISGMATILKKEQDREELDAIREAGIRLAHQIEDIQDYTELKRGELVLEEGNYMCVSLVNDIVANYRVSEKRKKLELVVDLDPATPTLLVGDIAKLHKLFRHLLDNALKFTKRGGIYIKVFPTPRDYGINLTIEVVDTGIGMTRADIAKVSKGMYQANKSRNRSTGGIGIGLPIVYGFVHKMGGFVHITSQRGAGTTVRLTIPQKVADPAPCLSLKEGFGRDIIFYIKPEKYRVPAIREFHKTMAVHLAAGLKVRLYSASDKEELKRLFSDLSVSHIFTGEEEYLADHEMLDLLAKEGCRVVVSAETGLPPIPGSRAIMMQKPLYGFPVVKIVNGELEGFEQEGGGRPRFPGVNALVVDDEPMNLVVATGLLREYGILPDTAESGKEAIEKYEKNDYEVIFMDHMMPEMDGVEAMKRIRQIADESGRRPVILALTANALSGAREMFLKEGFDGFIAKPIDIAEFERVMKNVLPEELIRYEGRDAS